MSLVDRVLSKKSIEKGNEYYNQAMNIYNRGAQRLTGRGELDEGISLSKKSREKFRSAKPKGSLDEAHALNLEASIHKLRLDYEKAIGCHDEGMVILNNVEPHDVLKAQFLNNLGELHRAKYNRGEYESSQEMLDEGKSGYHGDVLIVALEYSLQAVEEYKTRHPTNSGFIISLHSLGLVCRDFGNFETAEELLEMSTALATSIGDQNMAKMSLSCYEDVQNIKKQSKGYNFIRDRAFEYLADHQKSEVEELLAEAKVVSEFKK